MTSPTKEIFISEVFSLAVGLAAGSMLAAYVGKLSVIPGLFILLPGFLELSSSVSSSLSSRITAGLALGVIKTVNNKIVKGNIAASFILMLIVTPILGFFGNILEYIFFGNVEYSLILPSLLAGLVTWAVLVPFTIFATFKLFKKGNDPNNVMGPVITSIGDVVGIASLLVAVSLI